MKEKVRTIKKETKKDINITSTEKANRTEEIKRETTCDKCERIFYRKISNVKGKKQLTRVNELNYWLKEGKSWGGFEILCRSCLDDWFTRYRGEFYELVNPKKQQLYYQYRYLGLISKKSELYKESL